jgi:hypothetical protein
MRTKLPRNAVPTIYSWVNHGANVFLNAYTTPINLQMTPRHKPTIITRQERNHTRHIIRAPKPPQRRLLLKLIQSLLTPSLLEPWSGIDDARVNRVHADRVLAQFLRSGQCDTAECEFAGTVGDEARHAAQAGNGAA